MAEKTQEEETKTKIVETALKLFLENGIKAVSMDDVARALGISKRTLYTYFPSKDELLVKCLELMSEKQDDSWQQGITEGKNFIEFFLDRLYETQMFMQTVNPAFLSDLTKLNFHAAQSVFSENIEQRRLNIAELIERGKKDGFIVQDIDSDSISYVFFQKDPEKVRYMLSRSKLTHAQLMNQMALIFIRGMATEIGRKHIDDFIKEKFGIEPNK